MNDKDQVLQLHDHVCSGARHITDLGTRLAVMAAAKILLNASLQIPDDFEDILKAINQKNTMCVFCDKSYPYDY